MGLEEVWRILADLVTEFRKKDETVPSNVMADLRAAKTMIHVLKADPQRVENVPTIEAYLGKVESYLIMEAHQKFGEEFANVWLEKLKEAREITGEKQVTKPASRFVPGLPRSQSWVRIQISDETPAQEVKRLADESGLSYKKQRDGYMLVYGESEKLKLFVKKTVEKLGIKA